ncbi:MAG: hypothetical protein PHT00_04600 [Candidatus Methanomethylophilus sp.]|nr:hypothetical protein [Methanomethylophilus sp.]MDD4221689.1 hypothetical protein [Methanomethylophilus sp.]MDD4668261.1 hypothetical protein [Methanomethylophilus sp.]
MGINIGICETECAKAPCRELKLKVLRVKVPADSLLAQYGEKDEKVSLDDARKASGDLEALMKRNRINAESDAIYMEKLKKDEDIALLRPLAKSIPTGWVRLDSLNDTQCAEALKTADKDDRVTAWDEVSFDDMNAMCTACPLSWDKGRGCLGAFGPDNSQLPAIAQKAGCPLTASVPELAKNAKRLTPQDAAALLKEITVLRPALTADSKMAVRRYSGPLDRMEAVAKISVAENCGFYFF